MEARAAARLNHPSIVRVFDFGETDDGDPFIVMEVVHGESLAEVIDRRVRLNAIAAVQTLLPIAGALAAAYLRGIVHRDVKPDHVILVTEGVEIQRRHQAIVALESSGTVGWVWTPS